MDFSQDQLYEFVKCGQDISYFANKYIKITHPTKGSMNLVLNRFQKDVIDRYNNESMFFMSADRQEGKTTVTSVILLHQSLFAHDRSSAVMAPKLHSSNHLLDVIMNMYHNLPEFISKSTRIVERNRTTVVFDNRCSITSVGSSVHRLRAKSFSNVVLDEYQWIPKIDEAVRCIRPMMMPANSKLFGLSSVKDHELSETLQKA